MAHQTSLEVVTCVDLDTDQCKMFWCVQSVASVV